MDESGALTPVGGYGVRVLVADDEPGIRGLLRAMLEDEGYVVSEVANGQAALDMLTDDEHPTVALLDERMPQLSGSEVARAVARDTRLAARCACILLTGKSDRFAAAVDIPLVGKPFDLEALLEVVDAAARRVRAAFDGHDVERQ